MKKPKTIPVESLIKAGCELQNTLNCMTKLYNSSKDKSTNALANLQHIEDKLWIRRADVLEHLAANHGEEIKTKYGTARLDAHGQVEFVPVVQDGKWLNLSNGWKVLQ